MVSRSEQDIIEAEVKKIEEDMLEHEKEGLIMKGHSLGQMINENITTGINMSEHKYLEKELLLAVEFLVYLEMRIHNKKGWWFKSKTRIKFANMFRQNFKGHF